MKNGRAFQGRDCRWCEHGNTWTQINLMQKWILTLAKNTDVMGLGTACPTVFDEDTDMVAVARNIARFF